MFCNKGNNCGNYSLISGTTWMQELVSLVLNRGDPHLSHTVPNWARAPWLEQHYFPSLLKSPSVTPRIITTHLPFHLLVPALQGSKTKVRWQVVTVGQEVFLQICVTWISTGRSDSKIVVFFGIELKWPLLSFTWISEFICLFVFCFCMVLILTAKYPWTNVSRRRSCMWAGTPETWPCPSSTSTKWQRSFLSVARLQSF